MLENQTSQVGRGEVYLRRPFEECLLQTHSNDTEEGSQPQRHLGRTQEKGGRRTKYRLCKWLPNWLCSEQGLHTAHASMQPLILRVMPPSNTPVGVSESKGRNKQGVKWEQDPTKAAGLDFRASCASNPNPGFEPDSHFEQTVGGIHILTKTVGSVSKRPK